MTSSGEAAWWDVSVPSLAGLCLGPRLVPRSCILGTDLAPTAGTTALRVNTPRQERDLGLSLGDPSGGGEGDICFRHLGLGGLGRCSWVVFSQPLVGIFPEKLSAPGPWSLDIQSPGSPGSAARVWSALRLPRRGPGNCTLLSCCRSAALPSLSQFPRGGGARSQETD